MNRDDKRKFVVATIILSILVLALSSYLIYDKVLAKDKDANDIVENNKDNELNPNELYSNYLIKLKNNLEKVYNENDAEVRISSKSDMLDYYDFTLTKDGILLLSISKNEFKSKYTNYEVSKDVLKMFLVNIGNGGYKNLYFIKEDGTLNSLCVDCIANNQYEIKQLNYNNIINVVNSSFSKSKSGAYQPLFIDIEGNVFYEK